MINNDTKGKQFEHDCREIVKNASDYAFEKSLKINEVFMSDEVSINLWGFIKNKTDFDVIGIKNNVIIIIECKTKKKSSLKMKQKIKTHIKNSFDETYYKGKWISENFEKFCLLSKEQGFKVPKNCKYVIPLFVSNISPTLIENYNPVSLLELREFFKKIVFTECEPNFKIVFNSGLESKFSSFKIKIN